MTDQKPEISVKGMMPDLLAARAIKFAGTWDPDSATGNNTDEVQNLLTNIKNRQFRSEGNRNRERNYSNDRYRNRYRSRSNDRYRSNSYNRNRSDSRNRNRSVSYDRRGYSKN